MMKRFVMSGLLLLSACSSGKAVESAGRGVDQFHHMLDAGQFDAVYAGSDAIMKSSATQPQLVALLSAVHRKLGAFTSGKTVGWNVNVNTGGEFVTLNYAATYARGAANEQFVYHMQGEQPKLVGYNVNSAALIVN